MTENPNLIILESDILVRHPLAEYLRGCGYRVIEAADCDEARQILEWSETPIEVLFVSIAREQSEAAFAMAAWARQAFPDLQVELAGTVATAARKAGDLCAEEPLQKPYDNQLVHERIRRLIAARTPPDKPKG